jgi:hypothetical protein
MISSFVRDIQFYCLSGPDARSESVRVSPDTGGKQKVQAIQIEVDLFNTTYQYYLHL